MSEMKQNQRDVSRKEDLGIERAILDEATYSEFLLNTTRYAFSAQYVKSQTGGVVLDMACGTGYGIPFFSKDNSYVAADISLDALKASKSLHNSSHTSFVQCDAEHLPFKEGSFDLIMSFETIEHLENPRMFLSELERSAKHGSRIIISTPNRKYKAVWVRNINPYHVCEYNIRDFSSLVGEFFENLEVYVQVPPTSQRVVANMSWTIRKLFMVFPYSIASVFLQLARKAKRIVSKSAPECGGDLDLPLGHDYEIKPSTFQKVPFLRQPQTIIVGATKVR